MNDCRHQMKGMVRTPRRTLMQIQFLKWATAAVFIGIVAVAPISALADPSPTGSTPKLFWTPERQALWNRMRAENHPLWVDIESRVSSSATRAAIAYQVTGDPAYADIAWLRLESRLLGRTPPDSSRNFTRERFAEYVWMYDWLKPALSQAQRDQFLNSLNYWADLVLGRGGVKWGTRMGDSDETVGHYFGLAFLQLATADENPDAAVLLDEAKVGGLMPTGANKDSMRNAIKLYAKRAAGGGGPCG